MCDSFFDVASIMCRFSVKDLNERTALEQQIMEFGQTPKQLFHKPHPCKLSPLEIAKTEAKMLTLKTETFKITQPQHQLQHPEQQQQQIQQQQQTQQQQTQQQQHTEISDVSDHGEDISQSKDSSQKANAMSIWDTLEEVISSCDVMCEHSLHKGCVTHAQWNASGESVYSISAGNKT